MQLVNTDSTVAMNSSQGNQPELLLHVSKSTLHYG